MINKIVPLLIVAITLHSSPFASEVEQQLMPIPHSIIEGEGTFRIDASFSVSVTGDADERIYAAASRMLRRLDNRTGLFLQQGYVNSTSDLAASRFVVEIERAGLVELGEDESYRLVVTDNSIRLNAVTDLGAMHGMETLLQMLASDADGYYFPEVTVEDAPRFVWRGLMIDSARHFMPLEVLKRNLDGMAAVKMNVFHWHLTEDQGFRVESKTYPKLHELGSDGFYYTQEQIKEVIAYASARGIRVVPEFDMPGHATSWLLGYPEFGSAEQPAEIERGWGIFQPALNPANEAVYPFLDAFLGEMAVLFPDEYLHIGGDEVTGKEWDANPQVQSFMKEKGIADNHALQSYFNQRLLKILTKHGKKMIGWDEILQPDMPTNIVIHSWRGREAMVAAAKKGYRSMLSNGYYIDLMQPASFHYANDPLPADTELTDEEKVSVLGGEATMWSEHVTPETVDSRIWPRTAAIAERLWSAREVTDVDSMYDRLDTISIQLEEHGLTHIRNREMLMRRLVGSQPIDALRTLADVVEPLEIYARNSDLSYSQFSPYTLLPDIALADAKDARAFNGLVASFLETGDEKTLESIKEQLVRWEANHAAFLELSKNSPALREAEPISKALSKSAALVLEVLNSGNIPENAEDMLKAASAPVAKVELPIVESLQHLIDKYVP